jgi:hypothetical protein
MKNFLSSGAATVPIRRLMGRVSRVNGTLGGEHGQGLRLGRTSYLGPGWDRRAEKPVDEMNDLGG